MTQVVLSAGHDWALGFAIQDAIWLAYFGISAPKVKLSIMILIEDVSQR